MTKIEYIYINFLQKRKIYTEIFKCKMFKKNILM